MVKAISKKVHTLWHRGDMCIHVFLFILCAQVTKSCAHNN